MPKSISLIRLASLLLLSSAFAPLLAETALVAVSSSGDPQSAIVTFNAPLDPADASIASNYSIDRGTLVSTVELLPGGRTVRLGFSAPLSTNTRYTLSVAGLHDSLGNPLPGTSAFFDHVAIPSEEMALWLRGDGFLALDDESNVSAWFDQSGLGAVAVKIPLEKEKGKGHGKGKKKPEPSIVWQADALNGRPTVLFPGHKTGLLTGAIPQLDGNSASWFVVFKAENTEKKQFIISSLYCGCRKCKDDDDRRDKHGRDCLNLLNDINHVNLFNEANLLNHINLLDHLKPFDLTNAPWGSCLRDGELLSFAPSKKGKEIKTRLPLDSNWHFLSTVWGSDASLLSVLDGASDDSATGANAMLSGHKALLVGLRDPFSELTLKGAIAEIIIYSRELSPDERIKVEAYLNAKYFTEDSDGDGLPDAWELRHFGDLSWDADDDPDSDGLSNLAEYNAGTDPNNPDSDSDGMPDGWETANGLNPLLDDSEADPDNDSLKNLDEFKKGTDPQNPDSDSDGIKDGTEVLHSFIPTDINSPGLLDIIVNLHNEEVIR